MLPKKVLVALIFAATATAASAADLPRGSIGEIFAEPRSGRVVHRKDKERYDAEIAPWVNNSPWVPGYYGRPGDFYYRPYYGTPITDIYSRFPYACRWYGSC
ncbi:MAG: hypothetical protein ACOY4O_19750 [Pseudomonadota bacterium]